MARTSAEHEGGLDPARIQAPPCKGEQLGVDVEPDEAARIAEARERGKRDAAAATDLEDTLAARDAQHLHEGRHFESFLKQVLRLQVRERLVLVFAVIAHICNISLMRYIASMAWQWAAGALVVLAATAGLLVVAWRRRKLGRTFLVVTALLAGLWGFAKWATERDVRDANGWSDCWPSCTTFQETVAAGLGWAPLAWIVLSALAAVLAALSGPRGREWKPLDYSDR
jgi:hypothetical protein